MASTKNKIDGSHVDEVNNAAILSGLFASLGQALTDKEKIARQRILTNRYDVEAWEILGKEARQRPISQAAPLYEQILAIFPTSAKYWKSYAEAQMGANNDEAVRQIFSRCLLNCLHFSLWDCYLRFIVKVNGNIKSLTECDTTRSAFEFALSRIGTDIASGPIWTEYIALLESFQAKTPVELSQRMVAVRKVYQRAIAIPTTHLDKLWKAYESFELNMNPDLAKGLLEKYRLVYSRAKAVYMDRSKLWWNIDGNMLALPPTRSTSKEEEQWLAWKQYIAFEKRNPQLLQNVASLNKRITLAYEQCLMYLCHYPDIWYDYAKWLAETGSVDSAIRLFEAAAKALPGCHELFQCASAELHESKGKFKEAKEIYENLLSNPRANSQLAYIEFIRFMRRTEGVEAAHGMFLRATQSPNCTYHAYAAYAEMAVCMDNNRVLATDVFEMGLNKFSHEPAYILQYADFLVRRLNDGQSARALFEKILATLPPEKSIYIMNRYIELERTCGNLASMLKIERRKMKAISSTREAGSVALDSSLQDFISSRSFKNLRPCSTQESDHLARQDWLAKNPSSPSKDADHISYSTSTSTAICPTASLNYVPTVQNTLPTNSSMPRVPTLMPRPTVAFLPSVSAPVSPRVQPIVTRPPPNVAMPSNLPRAGRLPFRKGKHPRR
eukprot:Gb_37036 [translate_table: standard]